MIHTVTLNPTLDITYVIERFAFGEPVKAQEVCKSPGGKGMNVSRALMAMGTDSIAMALIGGYVGEEVLDLLQKEGLILQVVKIAEETRTNVIVLGREDGRELAIRSEGPSVEAGEADRISRLVFDTTKTPEVLVLCGSIPPGVDDGVYYDLIKEGKSRGTRVILDSKGEPLKRGVEAGPHVIKPNMDELEELAGEKLTDEPTIINYCNKLLEKDIWMVVVSRGRDGALMITGDGVWRGTVPFVNDDTVGAGDSMVAGLVMGIMQSMPLERMFEVGLSCGVSAVMNHGPELCALGTFDQALARVKIEKVV